MIHKYQILIQILINMKVRLFKLKGYILKMKRIHLLEDIQHQIFAHIVQLDILILNMNGMET